LVSLRFRNRVFIALGLVLVMTFALAFQFRVPAYEDRGHFSADVLRRYPQDHRALNNLGVFHYLKLAPYEKGPPDFDAAENAFWLALEIRPQYRRALLNRARARLVRQETLMEPIASLDILEGWLEPLATRNDADALYLLGKLSLRAGKAETDLEHAKEHFELAETRYEAAARGFLSREKKSAAAAAFKEAGMAAGERGEFARRKLHWRRALELAPGIQDAAALRATVEER
jgi:hypothetical protein